MAHFGVLVVDGVDEYKDDGDNDHRDCHESCYEGKVVLWNETKQEICQYLRNLKEKLPELQVFSFRHALLQAHNWIASFFAPQFITYMHFFITLTNIGL